MSETKNCLECGSTFTAWRKDQRFCKTYCGRLYRGREGSRKRPRVERPEAITCVICGETFTPNNFGKVPQTCSPKCVDALVYRNSDKEQRAEVAYKWRTTVGLEATRESARRNYQNNKEWYRDREYRERLLMKEAFVESIDKDTVYKRDQGVCQICDQHVDDELVWPHPESPSLDHIFPISLGGEHSYRNIQLTHLECNLSKNNKV